MTERVPPDQAARNRITADLDSTLFVDAGAGSGKTASLVDRVLALVTSGGVELESIAAITFTEKAASELKDRVREGLERRAQTATDDEERCRCRLALDQLDGAAIGTLHSFAQRILNEHPIEAGLPPRVEVLDEVSSGVAFEKRWSVFRDELLADKDIERSLLLFVAAGIKIEALHSMAGAFNDNWDLVEERVAASAPEPPDVREELKPILGEFEELCATPCRDPANNLRIRLDQIAEFVDGIRSLEGELDVLEAIGPQAVHKVPRFKVKGVGKGSDFDDAPGVRARVAEAGDRLESVREAVASAAAERLAAEIRGFTLQAAAERRRVGQLEFHDLLVLARSLLCDPVHGATVRLRLHDRYERLLLDEFQDTDPIQIELAVRIAACHPSSEGAGSAPWYEVPVEDGRLFFVGDPKQSIYRFRRADISMFLTAAKRFGADTGGGVELTANFRTVAPVIEWVNDTFERLMDEPGGDDLPVPSQPHYIPLNEMRLAPPAGPAVAVIGREAQPKGVLADEIRTIEAADVAATIVRAMSERWEVEDGDGSWREARFGDVTILVPSRTSLPFLEDALEAAGIAFRAESSSLVYASRAVRDLLMVLRAIDDPTNYLHIVSALRTPLLGCGDDDLFCFKVERRGRWSYLADQPDSVPADDVVREGLEYLRSLYEVRNWLAPSELLERITRERRAMELGFAEGRPRDVWRRLRFVIDQARSWSEATGGNLRQYIYWVNQQTAEGARVAEAILPETDDDAVRIMTIHSAKGLEFPITIVSGMSTAPKARWAPAEVVFPATGGVGYKFGKNVKTEEYESWAPIDEQMGLHERIRLLYVACTRARDHLVVSLHRKERVTPPKPHSRTNAELIVDGTAGGLSTIPDAVEEPGRVEVPTPVKPPPLMPFVEWQKARDGMLRKASRPTTVSATALTDEGAPDVEVEPDPGLEKRPRDLDLPPWLKGRYGTSVGRAVHGVLQTIDLETGVGLDAAVAAQCEAEAVTDRTEDVRRLVGFALESPSVREAASSPHWREVYVSTPVDGRVLEGYIDLLFRAPEGLVVVDYKTAATSDPGELARRVEGYRVQGASYAMTVGGSTGERVVRVSFVFLTPDGAVELDLPELELVMEEVGQLVGQ
jgi:ATP-dependent exoDNAse (exonuclease V) beta subunit